MNDAERIVRVRRMTAPACKTCRFFAIPKGWGPNELTEEDAWKITDGNGQCRRRAPVHGDEFRRHPLVADGHWCGEHEEGEVFPVDDYPFDDYPFDVLSAVQRFHDPREMISHFIGFKGGDAEGLIGAAIFRSSEEFDSHIGSTLALSSYVGQRFELQDDRLVFEDGSCLWLLPASNENSKDIIRSHKFQWIGANGVDEARLRELLEPKRATRSA